MPLLPRFFRTLVAFTAAVCAASPAFAQDRGSVRGTVTAADGKAPITGARVAVINPARAATTDEKGAYVLRDLPAGAYDVTATAVGREPSHNAVTVKAGETLTLDISLKAGSLMLSSVVISTTNAPTEARKVAATVNLLTPEQVSTTPARETQDMLREIPGVEMPRASSQVGGTAQIVSIRGVDEGRTAVLLDGIPLTDAWGEWVDWNRAPKGSIERVEVLEGGGSNLHGNGAMGGVISLFSRPISPGSYRLTVDGGSRDSKHTYASAGLPLWGPFSVALVGDYGDGGGYKLIASPGAGAVDTTSTSIRRNVLGRIEYAPSARLSAYVSGQLFNDDRHLGTPLSQTTRSDGASNFGVNYGSAATGYLSVRGWDSEMRESQVGTTLLTVSGVARAAERRTMYARIPSYDRGFGASWSRDKVFGFESVGVGADYRYMGGFYDEQDYANNAANAPTTHFNSGGNQSLSGAFVTGLLAPTDKLRIELSARVDRWGNNDGVATDASGTTHFPDASRSAFSPRVGLKYQVASTLALHTAVYQAFRAPNLAELYRKQQSATTITIPNPALKPEFATGYELGADWQPVYWFQVKGTIYQANYSDFNTFVTTSAAGVTPSTRMRENVQKSRSLGGEVYVSLRPVERLALSGSLNYDDARVSDLGPVAATATVFKGARIGRVPIQKATLRGSYDSPLLGTWVLMGRYEGSNTTLGNAFTLPEFGVMDASFSRPVFGGVSVFGSLENVFDRKYYTGLAGTAALPIVTLGLPRTFRVGVDAVRF
jgi:outer membrane receptor protein involved in Fe transport